MVLKGDKPQPTWSPVYADVADPKLTNWLWVQRLRRDQKDKILEGQRNRNNYRQSMENDKKYVHQQKRVSFAVFSWCFVAIRSLSPRVQGGAVGFSAAGPVRRPADVHADDICVHAGVRQTPERGKKHP